MWSPTTRLFCFIMMGLARTTHMTIAFIRNIFDSGVSTARVGCVSSKMAVIGTTIRSLLPRSRAKWWDGGGCVSGILQLTKSGHGMKLSTMMVKCARCDRRRVDLKVTIRSMVAETTPEVGDLWVPGQPDAKPMTCCGTWLQ